MADYRVIKKETFDDEKLADLPIPCRWLYVGLWCFADDNGIIRGSVKWIKPKVFPYDDSLRLIEVQKWIDSLEEARMILPIVYRNDSFYVIRTFHAHQKIDKRYAKYIIPDEFAQPLINEAKKSPGHFSASQKDAVAEEKRREENKKVIEENKEGATETEEDDFDGLGQTSKKVDPPGSGAPPLELTYPWTTEQFLCHWQIWKEYKWQEFKFKYKSIHSEQASLKELATLSKGRQDLALLIIDQSIAKSWKGFFELKSTTNGQSVTKAADYDSYKRELAERIRQSTSQG